ncbi:MAG TPA: hypothetical protein VLB46_02940 [Pyrinomonadaceae bacterium]|nr:hypothetical protein [Pyrinomonadaceae bacterium]
MAQLIKKAQPGDVITAEDWNLVVDAVNELLQSGQQTGISIAAVLPAGTQIDPFRIGTIVQVTGQNFGYSIGQTKVTFVSSIDNSVAATVFRPNMLEGSFDGRLLFIMPPIPNLPLNGMPMTMRVNNGVAEDHRSVYVMPVVNELAGDMFVTLRSDIQGNPEPNPLQTAILANFRYRLETGLNMPATFALNAEILSAPGTLIEIRDELGNLITSKQVQMGTNDVKNILVTIPALPIASGQSFTLRVTAASGAVVGTDQRSFTVGAAIPPPDPNIEANQTSFTLIDMGSGNPETPSPTTGILDGTTIKLKAGKRGVVNFSTKFTLAGTYEITMLPKAGATLSGWTPEMTPDSVGTRSPDGTKVTVTVASNGDQTLRTEKFRVTPVVGATPTGTIVFKIKRTSPATTAEFSKEFGVQLLP